MGKGLRPIAGPELLHGVEQQFGAELRHWRRLRDFSQPALGKVTHHSTSLISKIEHGQRRPTLAFARRMDAVLDTGGALERICPLPRAATVRPALPELPDDLGLAWVETGDTITTAIELWRADMDRRAVLVGAAWSAAVLATPARRWIDDTGHANLSHRGRRRIGTADVDAMTAMATTFSALDRQRGGGYARTTLVQFLDQVVGPLLNGTYDDRLGRQLFAATARLNDLAGFMCFDSGRHGLAQRYFTTALRLAHASSDQVLGAHILGDMAIQAHHLGHGRDAIALAETGRRTAQDGGSSITAARCSVVQARAHASVGDRTAAAAAMTAAGRDLDRGHPEDEPSWIRFFDDHQLHVEFGYVAHELGDAGAVQQLAAQIPADESAAEMTRREVLGGATLAASYLPPAKAAGDSAVRRGGEVDVDQACAVLTAVLPSAGGLSSSRGVDAVNGVRRQLAPYADRPSVRQLEADFHSLVGTAS